MVPQILLPKCISNPSSFPHFCYHHSRPGHHNPSPEQLQQTPNSILAIFQSFLCSSAIMFLKWKLVKISQKLPILPRILLKHNSLPWLLSSLWDLVPSHLSDRPLCYSLVFQWTPVTQDSVLQMCQAHFLSRSLPRQFSIPRMQFFPFHTSTFFLPRIWLKCHFPSLMKL